MRESKTSFMERDVRRSGRMAAKKRPMPIEERRSRASNSLDSQPWVTYFILNLAFRAKKMGLLRGNLSLTAKPEPFWVLFFYDGPNFSFRTCHPAST